MVNKWRRGWPPLAVIAAFVALWEAVVRLFGVEPYILPSPSAIVHEALQPNVWPRLQAHTLATVWRTLLGLVLGVLGGILLAAAVHLTPGARRALAPLLVLSQSVPVIVLGPLLLIWLGFGEEPKIALILLVCFFPVTIAMLTGLRESDPALRSYLAMIGADRWTIFTKLELPNAVPYLFSGFRIAAAYSVTTTVAAEWLGASSGLGYYIKLSYSGFETARIFAGTIIIIAFSMLLFGLAALAERLVVRWRPQTERGNGHASGA
jgi:ABC-type nitrate/sulfonate/bicarbonate transport system permease component